MQTGWNLHGNETLYTSQCDIQSKLDWNMGMRHNEIHNPVESYSVLST